jgi:WD40 repeat protein
VASFSPDCKTIATGADDGSAAIWNLRSGRLVETFEGHTASLRGAVFSPDGRALYTASSDGSVIAWDVSGGRRLGRPFRYSARTRKVRTGSAVGPDVLLIAASLIREFPAGSTVTFSPDGRTLAVGDSDGVDSL